MAYIGSSLDEVEKTVSTINVACDTMTGNGSTATLILSASQGVPESVNNISVYFDGVMQRPTNDYTLNYKTVTFTTAPETGVKVTVLSYANEFLNIVSDKTVYGSNIVDGAVTAAKQTGISFDNSDISGTMDAANLTGALPALDGSNLTGVASGQPVITNAADPTVTANPANGVGTIWINSTTGESYCCTDATAGDNVWTNIGSGTGSIAAPTNPTNAGGFVTPMLESTTYNYTFSGALDNASTPAGTVTHYMVDTISNGALTVAAAEVVAGQPHVFTAAAVGSNTAITFRVRAKDNDGHYSSGVTVSMTVQNNEAPTNPNNGGAFADMVKNTSYNYTFSGATDDNSVTHYIVDQFSNGVLSVSAAEVTAGSAHTFNAGATSGSDIAVTFRVRAKDNNGVYSSGVTVSMTVIDTVYTVATGGNISTSGDYKIHTFTSGGTFNVTTLGEDASVHYLVVGGGGSGGAYGGGGAGAGGFRTNYGSVSGRNSSVLGGMNLSQTSYSITVSGGAAGRTWNGNWGSTDTPGHYGSSSSFNGITATGGGGGAGSYGGELRDGACGGGASEYVGNGSGEANQGFGGGTFSSAGDDYSNCAGGGGGAGAAGQNASYPNAGNGGNGIQSNITGSNTYYAGGGGGSRGKNATGGSAGTGGLGGGSAGILTTNTNGSTRSGHATVNTGGGSGGSPIASHPHGNSGNGGSGVVIIRYKYQN